MDENVSLQLHGWERPVKMETPPLGYRDDVIRVRRQAEDLEVELIDGNDRRVFQVVNQFLISEMEKLQDPRGKMVLMKVLFNVTNRHRDYMIQESEEEGSRNLGKIVIRKLVEFYNERHWMPAVKHYRILTGRNLRADVRTGFDVYNADLKPWGPSDGNQRRRWVARIKRTRDYTRRMQPQLAVGIDA